MAGKIVRLPSKSSTFGRRMEIDLLPLSPYKRFWEQEAGSSKVWQVLANEYINKPYLDVPWLFGGAVDINHEGFIVHHRNHDVTHAVRQKHYAQKYLDLIDNYGNPEFSPVAKQIKENKEIKACLELAIYLCRSGRTNEKSGKDDPSNAKRSAQVFSATAIEMGFDPDLVLFLAFSIATHAPKLENFPQLINKLPGKHKMQLAQLLKGVIDLSHHTDLVRCKMGPPKEPVREQIDAELAEFLDPNKIKCNRVTTNMLLHATEACKLTGTRVKFRSFAQQDGTNTPYLKAKHTQDVLASMAELQSISLDPHRITHEGPEGDFAEKLRKANLTGVLDLTNCELNVLQIEQVKECIANSVLKQANLLGLQPAALQKTLIDLLEHKAVVQKTPIEIRQAKPIQEEFMTDFDRQFRQQAIDHKKTSMRFEPSRLGAAYKAGWSAFFSQLWKEIIGDIPQFGGEQHFTKITGVKKLSNPLLEERYKAAKGNNTSQANSFLTRELQTIQTDDVVLEPGEMLLYHGTSAEVAPLIMQNGFDEQRCKRVAGNGYGPLGKGVYFTSELSKASTFSTCAECGKSGQCSCVVPGTNQPADRVVLLCKVFVGNPEIILKKGTVNERTEPSESFDSCIALSQDIEGMSDFRSTEVCVPKGSQVIPLYEIRFSSQPNLLDLQQWKRTIYENGFSANRPLEYMVQESVELLKQLQNLRDIGADFSVIKNHAQRIENHLFKMERVLEAQGDILRDKAFLNADESRFYKQISIQLRDIKNFKTQVQALQAQTEDLIVSHTAKKESKNSFFESLNNFGNKIARFFLPKEYALKNRCTELAAQIQANPGTPSDFADNLTSWLNKAIERDKIKGTAFSWFRNQESPMHRVYLSQKMFNLKTAISELQEASLSEKALSSEIKRLLAETMRELDEYAKAVPSIKNAFSYKNLSAIIKTVNNIAVEEAASCNPILSSLKGASRTISVDELDLSALSKPPIESRRLEGVKAPQTTLTRLATIEEGEELEEDDESVNERTFSM